MDELKPCPCGRVARLTYDAQRRQHYAECTDAACWIGPDADSEELAAAAWNFRKPTDKPTWETAPEWATHLAMDKDGSWCWFEEEPGMVGFYWMPTGRFKRIWIEDWQKSIEKRP